MQTFAAWVGAVGGVLGIFVSVFAWKAAVASAQSAKISAETSRTAERAYVRISHVSPGLMTETFGNIAADVEVKNEGRTPADITAVTLDIWVGTELPEEAPYPDGRQSRVMYPLPAGDRIIQPYRGRVDPMILFEIQNDIKHLWLFGYLEYRDIFGRRYRAGYARRYEPSAEDGKNNLSLVMQPGYNYDRELQEWKER